MEDSYEQEEQKVCFRYHPLDVRECTHINSHQHGCLTRAEQGQM